MSYSVYLESSIVDLKPRVLDFLTLIVEKAKEAKDYVISMKKKDLADMAGKDTRTITRYLNELEEQDIIETAGRRGRSGGTVIKFNTELIRFDTSDKALINTDEPESIEEIIERKFPKKQMPENNNKKKRNRRTKRQMVEARILQQEKDSEAARLNEKVIKLGGVPNWEWFQETEDPIGNYRTYIITRMYNRYAVLFTDRHNSEVMHYNEGNQVPFISNNYDVLEMEFYGTSRWNQFEKLRKFLEENDIDPAVYLSSQFSRTIFTSSNRNTKKTLPFVNALTSDTSYDVYKQYCSYQKKASHTYAAYQMIPAQFADDFVIRAMNEAYATAESGAGMLEIRQAIEDFMYGFGSTEEDEALLGFYRLTSKELRNSKISRENRNTLKKYLMLQSLSLTGGISKLPNFLILGSEVTRAALVSIDNQADSKEKASYMKALALGLLTHPQLPQEEQVVKGKNYLYQYNVLHETPQVLRLILERKNLHVAVRDVNEALKEYGREKIPVDDLSILDVKQVVNFMMSEVPDYEVEPEEEINIEDVTTSKEWVLTGAIGDEDPLESALNNYLEEIEE